MKNLYKNILQALVIAFLFSSMAHAQKGELLITAKKVGNNIDVVFELLSESNVSALQFDIEFPKNQSKSLSVTSCTSSMGKSSLAGCKLNYGNILRVAMINQGLKNMKSGEVGRVTLKNAAGILESELIVSNARLITKQGKGVAINAVVDYQEIKITDIYKPILGEKLK